MNIIRIILGLVLLTQSAFGDTYRLKSLAEVPLEKTNPIRVMAASAYQEAIKLYQVRVKDGRALALDRLFGDRWDNLNGRFNYILDQSGELIVASRTKRHAILANGQPVAAAGEIHFEWGKVSYISNLAKDYEPEAVHLNQMENRLKELGLLESSWAVDFFDADYFSRIDPRSTFQAEVWRGSSSMPLGMPAFKEVKALLKKTKTGINETQLTLEKLIGNDPDRIENHSDKLLSYYRNLDTRFYRLFDQLQDYGSLKNPILNEGSGILVSTQVPKVLKTLQDLRRAGPIRIELKNGAYVAVNPETSSHFQSAMDQASKLQKWAIQSDEILSGMRKDLQRYRHWVPADIHQFHMIWIGSPLGERHADHLIEVCDWISNKNEVAPKESTPVQLHLWTDEALIGEAPLSRIEDRIMEQCGSNIELHDISELFKQEEADRLEYLSTLTQGVQIGSAPNCGYEKVKKHQINSFNQLQSAYRFLALEAQNGKLGAQAFAPMVDLLKLAVLYQKGGIYFDFNKNFDHLHFTDLNSTSRQPWELIIDELQGIYFNVDWNHIIQKKSADGSSQTDYLKREEFLFSPSYFIPNYILKNGRIGAEERIGVPSSTDPNDTEVFDHPFESFINVDYLGVPKAGSSLIGDVIRRIGEKYEQVQKNPILKLFMDPKYFSTFSWVFSFGGPVALTEVLGKEASRLRTISSGTINSGSRSWRNPDQIDLTGLVYLTHKMHALLNKSENLSNQAIQDLFKDCFRGLESKAPIFPKEVQTCLQNRIMAGLNQGIIPELLLMDLNDMARHFHQKAQSFKANLKKRCGTNFYQFDPYLLQVYCLEQDLVEDQPEKIVKELRLSDLIH